MIKTTILSLCVMANLWAVEPQRLKTLEKGINLSHWLWMPMDHGKITDQDLAQIKAAGFTHVRLPVSTTLLVPDWNQPQNLNTVFLKDVTDAIALITKHGLGVIVSAFDTVDKIANTDLKKVKLFWVPFATALKNTDPNLVFPQIANEPDVPLPSNWNRITAELVQTIRAILPNHTIMTATPLKFGEGSGDWGTVQALIRSTPVPDKNVVYALNCYEPFFFTHQGADWSDPVAKHIKNLAYPLDAENVRAVKASMQALVPADHWIYGWLDGYKGSKAYLEAFLEPLFTWGKQHNINIHFSEFGAYKLNTPAQSRLAWLKDIREVMQANKAGWSLWDYSGGFGIVDDKRIFEPAAISALFQAPKSFFELLLFQPSEGSAP